MNNNTIFVGIASYRDAELIPTLLDMLEQAQHPAALHIAICWQDDRDLTPFLEQGFISEYAGEHEGLPLYRLKYGRATLDLLAVDYLKSQGACWARHLSNTLYSGERYHLQIDSHSRFIPHWDSEMITMLESLREQSSRPVLTHYPPPYTPEQETEKRSRAVSRLVFHHFNEKGIPSMQSAVMNESRPRAGGFIAAGLIFCDGHFIENVPYDPQLFFNGEEISLAARAYTHGYDVYTPHKVLIWHFYSRCEAPKFWSDHTGEAKEKGEVAEGWWERDAVSCKRIRSLLTIDDDPIDLGRWGVGQQRSLQEFQYRVGLDFRQQLAHPQANAGEQITWFEPLPADHKAWLDSLISRHQHLWHLTKAEVDFTRSDVLWWQLSVHQADNTPLMNRQLTPEELNTLMQDMQDEAFQLNVQFDTPSAAQPHCIRLCPYVDQQGWGSIQEKMW